MHRKGLELVPAAMPIKPIPPRPGKTSNWLGRGTHFGQYVNRSIKARQRALAVEIIRRWEQEIERGEFIEPGEPTFAGGGLDLRGLVGTDRWKDIKSTAQYAHLVPSKEAQPAALLPSWKMRGKRA